MPALHPARVAALDGAALTYGDVGASLGPGLRVRASSDVREGAVVDLGAGVGPLAVRAPCRVVRVVRGDDVAGFAYGTLPGHPESGEESFTVRLEDDGRVTFTVRAFAVEASLPARLSGRLGWALQRWVTDRYLRALGGSTRR